MHNPAPVLENDPHKLLWDFDIHADHLISAKRPDLIIINNNKKKKKRICKIVEFTVPADHRIKLKEWEKKDKYLDLARELKKLWNMKVTIIPIVIGAFGTITKGLLNRLEDLGVDGRVETIQATALLKTDSILRRVLETWGDFLSLKLQWKTISWRWCRKLWKRKYNNNNNINNNKIYIYIYIYIYTSFYICLITWMLICNNIRYYTVRWLFWGFLNEDQKSIEIPIYSNKILAFVNIIYRQHVSNVVGWGLEML